MTPLPSPDSHNEDDYVAAQVHERYWEIPPGLFWLLLPLLAGIAGVATTSELHFPIPVFAGCAAAVGGLLLARFVAGRVPGWNCARRKKLATDASVDFRRRFKALESEFEGVADDVEQLRKAVDTKSYRLYVARAKAVNRCRNFVETDLDLFFSSVPNVISELMASVEELIGQVESDPSAVTAYAPDLLDRIEHFRRRATAGNILDCYRASKELEPIFASLARRDAPFNFAVTVRRLKDQAQECRDQILSDPRREAIWREIQHKDERLQEERRHNEAMEEAAEAQAEAERQQAASAEERNEIMRQQRNAERAIAAGTAATAYYTRKTANATREIAQKGNQSTEHPSTGGVMRNGTEAKASQGCLGLLALRGGVIGSVVWIITHAQ